MNAVRAPRNRAASIRQRLLDLTRAQKGDFQGCLDRYAVERLIYRLSISEARERFLLKGALLFTAWFDVPHRPICMTPATINKALAHLEKLGIVARINERGRVFSYLRYVKLLNAVLEPVR